MVRSAALRSWEHPCSPPPLMRNCTFHWIQHWERASRSRPNSLVLLSSVRDHRLPRADRPALAGTLGPSCCGSAARLQPEGALPLLEPTERLAGDPVVAVLLQVPAGRHHVSGLALLAVSVEALCCAGEPLRSAVGCWAMRRGGPTTGGCSPTASGCSTAALRRVPRAGQARLRWRGHWI